jgi:hypothetical protein
MGPLRAAVQVLPWVSWIGMAHAKSRLHAALAS